VFLSMTNGLDHEDVVRSGKLRKIAVRVRLHPVSFPVFIDVSAPNPGHEFRMQMGYGPHEAGYLTPKTIYTHLQDTEGDEA
jgi:hypothetical protein